MFLLDIGFSVRRLGVNGPHLPPLAAPPAYHPPATPCHTLDTRTTNPDRTKPDRLSRPSRPSNTTASALSANPLDDFAADHARLSRPSPTASNNSTTHHFDDAAADQARISNRQHHQPALDHLDLASPFWTACTAGPEIIASVLMSGGALALQLPSLPPAASAPRLRPLYVPPPPAGGPGRQQRPAQQALDCPYDGAISGVTWNAQALFARSAIRHARKAAYTAKLIGNRDFITLSETHGSEGEASLWFGPANCQSWWSAGSASRAGVGIIVKKAFLMNFVAELTSWEEIVPGRAAVLRLRGPQGALDLHAVYFATGTPSLIAPQTPVETATVPIHEQRQDMRTAVAAACCPSEEVLSIISGDFNWVAEPAGRVAKVNAEQSGGQDAKEERHWRQVLSLPLQFHELRQDGHTHDSALARSRLDRVYWNQAPSEQLDRQISCAALEWVPRLSAHRAVAFARRRPEQRGPEPRPLPPHLLRHPDWPMRVATAYHEALLIDDDAEQAIRRLAILKKHIRAVTEQMAKEAAASPAEEAHADDRLGWTMRFIRAAEQQHQGTRCRCIQAYAHLGTLSTEPLAPHLRLRGGLHKYRQHAVELARDAAIHDLQDLHRDLPTMSEEEARTRRHRNMQTLRRLAPGRGTALAAVQAADGSVVTEPAAMAAALRQHWSSVFVPRRCNRALLQQWLREDIPLQPGTAHASGLTPPADPRWAIRRSDVRRAVDASPNSAPGPDGIPFLAWRQLGGLGVDVLHAAMQDITAEGGVGRLERFYSTPEVPGQTFNSSLMVFLPKAVSGNDPSAGDYCSPADTRPLNLVNCDNRLLANAARIRAEPLLEEWVSPMQRGFLAGRSMLSNVIDIDQEMVRIALQEEAGAAIFFDFQAAFPSVLHEYLHAVLRHLGLPAWLLHFVEALYQGNHCQLVVGGGRHPGFTLAAGIRQGCPLSPLIFAVAADLLLRRMSRLLPQATPRAYADDLAVTLPDGRAAIPTLIGLFAEYESFTGLRLNMPKTSLVPLYLGDKARIHDELAHEHPSWAGMKVEYFAKYLGFVMGPDRQDRTYDKPLAKFASRAEEWGMTGAGLHLTTLAYAVYILPVVLFVAQLDAPPENWGDFETKALRKLLPGPGHWFRTADVRHLQQLGMPKSFPDLACITTAAQFRVHCQEAAATGGLQIRSRAATMRRWLATSPQVARCGSWFRWFQRAFVLQLDDSRRACEAKGITQASVELALAKGVPRPYPKLVAIKIRKGFQRTTRAALQPTQHSGMAQDMRRKVERWRTPQFPRVRAQRAVRALQTLRTLVPPRVIAALIRSLWNGWVTSRRMQKATHDAGGCIFGCEAVDCIEHYASCIRVAEFARKWLRLPHPPTPPEQLADFLLLDAAAPAEDPARLTRKALRLAAVYHVHNWRRHRPSCTPAVATEALAQALREATLGHPGAMRCLESTYTLYRNHNSTTIHDHFATGGRQ
jgi:hypothetical protein